MAAAAVYEAQVGELPPHLSIAGDKQTGDSSAWLPDHSARRTPGCDSVLQPQC